MLQLIRGDMTQPLPFADRVFTAVLTDPPYGLQFMGKRWDHGVPDAETWREVWRVCKPGAVLLAFGGTRTWHRLAVALEDAGWEIEDTLMWLYGSGFPKSTAIGKAIDREAGAERKIIALNPNSRPNQVGKERHIYAECIDAPLTAPATPEAAIWEGYGTALKPAWEPILFCRKSREGTYAQNALQYGAGAIWIDGARIGVTAGGDGGSHSHWSGRIISFGSGRDIGKETAKCYRHNYGRWPANLLLDEAAAEMLEEQSGMSKSSSRLRNNNAFDSVAKGHDYPHISFGYDDIGTAARFFYIAKAARGEREAGLEGMPATVGGECYGDGIGNGPDRILRVNNHPTVKPLALCRYLATLIRPPEPYLDEAALFVPYAGSGSEMIGALLAGWRNVVGIEIETDYMAIAQGRLDWWEKAVRRTGLTEPGEVLAAMRKLEQRLEVAELWPT